MDFRVHWANNRYGRLSTACNIVTFKQNMAKGTMNTDY